MIFYFYVRLLRVRSVRNIKNHILNFLDITDLLRFQDFWKRLKILNTIFVQSEVNFSNNTIFFFFFDQMLNLAGCADGWARVIWVGRSPHLAQPWNRHCIWNKSVIIVWMLWVFKLARIRLFLEFGPSMPHVWLSFGCLESK